MPPAPPRAAPPTVEDVRAASARLRARLSPEERYAGFLAYAGSLEPEDLADFDARFAPRPAPCACILDPCAETLVDPALWLALGWQAATDDTRRAFIQSVTGQGR